MDEFVHLHNHSHFSLLDGFGSPSSYAERVAELGQPALAITDHGSLSGIFQHWKECRRVGVKPIVGTEAYVAPYDHTVKQATFWGTPDQRSKDISGGGAFTHLTLLAVNSTGIRSLLKLQAHGYAKGFYRKPRIDLAMLDHNSDGLICLTGCPGSAISTRIRLGHLDEAVEEAGRLKAIFGPDRLFVEVMEHGIIEDSLNQAELNTQLQEDVAAPLDLPLILTNDCHYSVPEDAAGHDAFLCIQTQAQLTDEKRFRFSGQGFYLKSRAEMDAIRGSVIPASAANNTVVVANMVESYDDFFDGSLKMPEVL